MQKHQAPRYPILLVPSAVNERDFFPRLFTYEAEDDIPIGASEAEFGFLLRYYFGEYIKEQQQLLPTGNKRPFSTDFLFIEPNTCLHIDIEVDEPFAFSTGEPIHCVGDDDYRNKCFTEANFIVMRFAEEQVRTQPLRCLRFLTKVINRYTSNDTWIHLFSEVERITQIKQWTNSGARKLKKQDYRQRYLNN